MTRQACPFSHPWTTVSESGPPIHELRARVGRVNYRILYFFNGRGVAVLTNGCTKQGAVDDSDIDRAVHYKSRFRANTARHTYQPPTQKRVTDRQRRKQ